MTRLRGLDAKMLLQVHDELLFEVAEGDVDKTIEVARDVMEGAADPAVRAVSEAGRGCRAGGELGGGALRRGFARRVCR